MPNNCQQPRHRSGSAANQLQMHTSSDPQRQKQDC
jgi:hypothetical protein